MIKQFSFLFLFSLALNVFGVDDTLKLRPKHFFELNIGGAANPGLIPSNKKNKSDIYSASNIKTFSFDYGYRLKTKKANKMFFLEAGFNYLNFNIRRELVNVKYVSKTSNATYNYDKNDKIINYDISAIGISLKLEFQRYFENLLIAQKLGLNHTQFLNSNKTYTYNEIFETNYIQSDPSAPGGFSNAHIYEDRTIVEKMNFFHNYVTVIYNIGVGYKINHFAPFISGELSLFNGDSFIFNYQGGIKIFL